MDRGGSWYVVSLGLRGHRAGVSCVIRPSVLRVSSRLPCVDLESVGDDVDGADDGSFECTGVVAIYIKYCIKIRPALDSMPGKWTRKLIFCCCRVLCMVYGSTGNNKK